MLARHYLRAPGSLLTVAVRLGKNASVIMIPKKELGFAKSLQLLNPVHYVAILAPKTTGTIECRLPCHCPPISA